MEPKKTGRITIKSLSEAFEKEIKYLKNKIDDLEEQISNSDTKVKDLEKKFSQKTEVCETSDEINKNCKVCGRIFDSKSSLKKHMEDCHTIL